MCYRFTQRRLWFFNGAIVPPRIASSVSVKLDVAAKAAVGTSAFLPARDNDTGFAFTTGAGGSEGYIGPTSIAECARAAERDVRVRCFHVYALTRKSTRSFFKNWVFIWPLLDRNRAVWETHFLSFANVVGAGGRTMTPSAVARTCFFSSSRMISLAASRLTKRSWD
jgi:hypothetical protein